jgi:hypothetical protein
MIKKLSVMIFVLAFFSAALAQEVVKQKAPMIDDRNLESSSINVILSGDNPVTAANYVPVDTMANAFGPASNTLNPVAFDPISGVLAFAHRGYSAYALGSGEIWWNWSTDMGANWTRSETSVQNGQTATILGRYPSMTIFNPSASSSMADVLGVFSWPELNPSTFGYIGYGVSEGMMQSSFAAIDQGPPAYSSNVPTFADDQYSYWYSDNGTDNALRLWRTADFSTIDVIDPPTWGTTRWTNGNILLGGVAHNGVVYVGAIGSYTEEIGAGGWEIGYSKSTDHGTTWSDWFVPDWRTISGLSNFTELWDWKLGDAYVSYSGDIQVDASGNVHLVTGLTDSLTLQNAIVEIYETAPNVWAGKVISAAHDKSLYGYAANTPGLGQTGPSIMIAANENRDFFAVQYTIGSPETADTLCDLYYQTRALGDANWSSATNLTETNNMNEDGCHIAPYMATSGGTDYIFSGFWYEMGNTGPTITQTNPAVFFVAPVAVRTAGGNTVDITFNVDMGVQASKGQFNIGDPVKIAGNFNGWNNGADVLTDADADTIYTITKTFNVGDTLLYKFIKGADGWENDPNRQYIVPASNSTITVYFNDDTQYAVPTTIDVTFSCNMEYEIVSGRFNPATDTLSVRGNFNGWGSSNLLFQSISDPNIYEGTFPILTYEGYEFLYKYAYFGGGNTTWENDPNKSYVVTADDITLGSAFIERTFNNANPSTITNYPVTIKFTVNMTGAISSITLQPFPSIDDVRLCGANAPLKWPAGGWPNADSTKTIKLYDNGTNGDVTSGDNIWSRDVTFPQYSPLTIQYKYGANWGLASNEGGNDNENGVGADHFINLTPTMISATVENVFGTMGTHTLVNVVTDVEDLNSGIPTVYDLGQNYPNPFNPSTIIRFSIPEAGFVTLKVFNLLGEEVATLLNAEKTAGNYEATFDASNLSSGIYFYKLESQNFTSTKKMLLLK